MPKARAERVAREPAPALELVQAPVPGMELAPEERAEPRGRQARAQAELQVPGRPGQEPRLAAAVVQRVDRRKVQFDLAEVTTPPAVNASRGPAGV